MKSDTCDLWMIVDGQDYGMRQYFPEASEEHNKAG